MTYHICGIYGMMYVNYAKLIYKVQGNLLDKSFLNFSLILGKISHMYTHKYTHTFCLKFCFFFTVFLWSHNSVILEAEQMVSVHKLSSTGMTVSPP